MELDVRRILLLAEIERRGSITAAANALNYTVSAVSQQVSKLEAETGQLLLERHARGIWLTEAGRAVVRHAHRIDRQLRAARAELDDLAELRSGELRFGTFPTASASLLPLAVTAFRTAHPSVRLTVRSTRFAGLVEMLETREIELSLLWDYDWRRVADPDLDIIHLFDDPSDLVVAATHPLAGRTVVNLAELADEQWITRAEDHPVAEVLARSCHATGFEPRVVYKAHDYQEAQAMVAVGLGVALAPRLALTGLRTDVSVIPLGPSAPMRRILLANLRERRLSPAGSAITGIFQDLASKFTR
jgi:molybdate transport repressor ModE-like protein